MSEHADFVVVQYPRGAKAVVWFDLVTGEVATNHAGLREVLRRGIKGRDGRMVYAGDGARFLSAVYDHFFLSGSGCSGSAFRVPSPGRRVRRRSISHDLGS